MNFFDEDYTDYVPLSLAEDPPDDLAGGFDQDSGWGAWDSDPLERMAADADSFADLIDSIVETNALLATIAARRAELIDRARLWNEATVYWPTDGPGGWSASKVARRTLVTELACALRVPERSAESLIAESKALLQQLPATLHALRGGRVSYRHCQRMIDHACSLPVETRESFEEAVLPFAVELTVSRFDARARTVREKIDSSTIRARHVMARSDRELLLQPARDGMAWLSALLPASTALAAYDRVTSIATSLASPGEERTLTQLRADVLSGLLIDGSTSAADRGIRAKILVTVPVMTLLGHTDEPAMLEGYGPIDADTARRIAAHAPSFTRILTHPETGAVLSVGRDSYPVPSDLRTWLRVRDGTCRFPGCSRTAGRCDIDHTIDWHHTGETEHDNLAHVCRSHHGVKHHTDWTVRHKPSGSLEWTAPSGRNYTTAPETMIEPEPPPESPPF